MSFPAFARSTAEGASRKVNVGLIDQHDCLLRLVRQQPLDVRVAGQCSGGIVGRADVEHSGIGRGSHHGFDVMRVGFGQRQLDHSRARSLGGMPSGLVGGIGGNQTRGWRAELHHRVMQRIARSGKDADVVLGNVNTLGIQLHQVASQLETVAPALRNEWDQRFLGGCTWAQRILVSIDHDRAVFGDVGYHGQGQLWLGYDPQGQRCGGCGGNL